MIRDRTPIVPWVMTATTHPPGFRPDLMWHHRRSQDRIRAWCERRGHVVIAISPRCVVCGTIPAKPAP